MLTIFNQTWGIALENFKEVIIPFRVEDYKLFKKSPNVYCSIETTWKFGLGWLYRDSNQNGRTLFFGVRRKDEKFSLEFAARSNGEDIKWEFGKSIKPCGNYWENDKNAGSKFVDKFNDRLMCEEVHATPDEKNTGHMDITKLIEAAKAAVNAVS
jgi:hypothetical protein